MQNPDMTPKIVDQCDLDWLDEAVAWQWPKPVAASPFWRSWGIRHIRAFWKVLWASIKLDPFKPDWRALWYAEWCAYAIRRGWW